MLVPKGARVVFQLYYDNAQLAPQTDLTELRLRAAKGPVQKRLHFMRVGQFRLTIPAGNPRYEIEAGSFVQAAAGPPRRAGPRGRACAGHRRGERYARDRG